MKFLLFDYFFFPSIGLFLLIAVFKTVFKNKKTLNKNRYLFVLLISWIVFYEIVLVQLAKRIEFIDKIENLDSENIDTILIKSISGNIEKIIIDKNEINNFASDLKSGSFCLKLSPFDLQEFKLEIKLLNDETIKIKIQHSSNNGLVLDFFLEDGMWIGSAKNNHLVYYFREHIE